VEILQDSAVSEIIARLQSTDRVKGAVKVEGSWGSFARLLGARITRETNRPAVYICPHIEDADKAADDLFTFGAREVAGFPAWEGEEDVADATDEIRAERLKVVLKLNSGQSNLIIPCSVQALCQPVAKSQALAKRKLQLQKRKEISPERIVDWLVENGFERVDRVDLPGQFVRRGGIIDIYSALLVGRTFSEGTEGETETGTAAALRVEFFGDSIESIREINLDSQLSIRELEKAEIVSAVCGIEKKEQELFLNMLPEESIIILEEPSEIEEVAGIYLNRVEDAAQLYDWGKIYRTLKRYTQLQIFRFAPGATEQFIKLDIKSIQRYQHKASSIWAGHKERLEELVHEAKGGKEILFYCESAAQIKRVSEIVCEIAVKLPVNFKLLEGFIHEGFVIDSLDTIVVTHHELFGQYGLVRRRYRPVRTAAAVDTLSDLNAGDYVVHISYGIGKFQGIRTIEEKGGKSEYLSIEYADGVTIQVAARNIAFIQKYIGSSPKRPKLSKVGSRRWRKQKERVSRSVEELAGDMLALQAKRESLGGIAYDPDSNWQIQFEEAFAYQETPDQIRTAEQIKLDMCEAAAMDRLLCGDVGYGKTELAMRSAFKAVECGRQVALLAPTTVLSVQHGRTFMERFADFPICIEVLNRFKSPSQARDIIERTKSGRVDILIGTHRLLSGDVGFRELGLLIIDEEQRFGVADKEKLKKMRVNVDILTMTATPIPRTLHMSLLGLRDISSLATPPLDRRSIVTNVTAYDNNLIRKAIFRELNRGGQVFFVHNRVKTIDKKAWELQKLVEEAKVSVAHGQMSKRQLEKTMIDFVLGRIDVLVCTTIIESGLDIPNANTIFINDSDRFGLSEMHQLRGRVGRYKHRAYAYMLIPKSRPISPVAARRLKAIEEYCHLGAGFRIALRDLEIRGAGNILGPEQSGHIQTVGYQMYCELLSDAVRKLKNEPVQPIPSANIDLGYSTYIPKSYIPQDRQRMDVYRKISVARSCEDLKQIEAGLEDIYGPVPEEVTKLLETAELRILASKHRITSIAKSGSDVIFSFKEGTEKKIEALLSRVSGRLDAANPKTAYVRLKNNYFEPKKLASVLRKILINEK